MVQERITAFCEAEGLTCVDMLPVLERLGPAAFLDYDHLSRTGSALTADTLQASGLLPEGFSNPADLEESLRSSDLAGTDGGDAVLAWLQDPEGPVPSIGRPALAGGLAAEHPGPRMGAAWATGRLDPEGTGVPSSVVEALRADAEPGVRVLAAQAIGGLGAAGRPGVPALFDALDDAHEAVRHAAARGLSEQKLALDDLPALERALGSDDTYVRAFAAWRVGNFGAEAEPAVPALVTALQRPQTHPAVSAALARIGPGAAAAVPGLLEELSSPDASRRWRAARALGRIGPGAAGAVDGLAEALHDSHEGVRRHAARALGRIGPSARSAIDELQDATEDVDRGVRREATKALKALDGVGRESPG